MNGDVVVSIVGGLGFTNKARDILPALARLKANKDDAAWLMGLMPVAGFDLFRVELQNNELLHLAPVRGLVAAMINSFGLGQITVLCHSFPTRLVEVAQISPLARGCFSFFSLYLNFAGGTPPPQIVDALFAEAALRDNAALVVSLDDDVTYGQADTTKGKPNPHKKANIDKDSRTGLLTVHFNGGPVATIHTHWAAKGDKRLVSAHVQYGGKNGAELNANAKLFGRLMPVVLAAHAGAGVVGWKA